MIFRIAPCRELPIRTRQSRRQRRRRRLRLRKRRMEIKSKLIIYLSDSEWLLAPGPGMPFLAGWFDSRETNFYYAECPPTWPCSHRVRFEFWSFHVPKFHSFRAPWYHWRWLSCVMRAAWMFIIYGWKFCLVVGCCCWLISEILSFGDRLLSGSSLELHFLRVNEFQLLLWTFGVIGWSALCGTAQLTGQTDEWAAIGRSSKSCTRLKVILESFLMKFGENTLETF